MVREHIGLQILSWKKVDSEARDKLWDEITRYFDLPRSKQAADERILLLESQLDAARCEREEKELLIKSMSSKMSQTEGMVTKLKNQLAAQGWQLQSTPTQLTPLDVSLVDICNTPKMGRSGIRIRGVLLQDQQYKIY
ncbi:hypothetical protein Tco_0043111, partial [Tanacetum coccineum]